MQTAGLSAPFFVLRPRARQGTEQHEAIEAQRGREGDHIRSIGVERIVELRATLRKAAAADIEHVDVVRRGSLRATKSQVAAGLVMPGSTMSGVRRE